MWTWSNVPTKISTIAQARQKIVSLSDVNGLSQCTILLLVIGRLCSWRQSCLGGRFSELERAHKILELCLLHFQQCWIPYHLHEPRSVGPRYHCAQNPRRGCRVFRCSQVHKVTLDSVDVTFLDGLFQFCLRQRCLLHLTAPPVDIRRQPACFAGECDYTYIR